MKMEKHATYYVVVEVRHEEKERFMNLVPSRNRFYEVPTPTRRVCPERSDMTPQELRLGELTCPTRWYGYADLD